MKCKCGRTMRVSLRAVRYGKLITFYKCVTCRHSQARKERLER